MICEYLFHILIEQPIGEINMPVQMIELEEVTMEISDATLEASARALGVYSSLTYPCITECGADSGT